VTDIRDHREPLDHPLTEGERVEYFAPWAGLWIDAEVIHHDVDAKKVSVRIRRKRVVVVSIAEDCIRRIKYYGSAS
jgi:hypothetical protein